MSYRVTIESFEGPFDLLLSLVSEQKLDIGRISVSEVADQYLAHIEGIRELDMEVASDFLLVASTLLALKTDALLPDAVSSIDDDLEQYTPEEARDLLVSRLLAYKQFKNAAAALNSRLENEGRMHARQAGLEGDFVGLLPDYLAGVTLHSLAVICADLAARREVFLLEAEHVVARPIEIERVLAQLLAELEAKGSLRFAELFKPDAQPGLIVAGFLSLLELYHRGMIDIDQIEAWGDIEVVYRAEADWQPAADVETTVDPLDEFLEQLVTEVETDDESNLTEAAMSEQVIVTADTAEASAEDINTDQTARTLSGGVDDD